MSSLKYIRNFFCMWEFRIHGIRGYTLIVPRRLSTDTKYSMFRFPGTSSGIFQQVTDHLRTTPRLCGFAVLSLISTFDAHICCEELHYQELRLSWSSTFVRACIRFLPSYTDMITSLRVVYLLSVIQKVINENTTNSCSDLRILWM